MHWLSTEEQSEHRSLCRLLLVGVLLAGTLGCSDAPRSSRSLAFVGLVGDTPSIFVCKPDGSKSQQLTHGMVCRRPQWSPSGNEIVFVGATTNSAHPEQVKQGVWIVSSSGGTPRLLGAVKQSETVAVQVVGGSVVRAGAKATAASWSPDGKRLAYAVAGLGSDEGYCVWVVNADGTKPRMIYQHKWSLVAAMKYTITVDDLMGKLIKNVFREEQARSVNLGDIENLSETDREFLRLEIGALPLVQTPIPGALDGATYSKLRSAAQRKSGPHGGTREGRSFEEVAAQKKAYEPPGVTVSILPLSIRDVARSNCEPGSFFACLLDGEPRAVAVLHDVRDDQMPTIKRTVEGGSCIFRGDFFSMTEYPLVHIGLGVPVEYLDDSRVALSIVENLANFMEANFQDWVAALEAKKYTKVHVYGPDYSHIATGRTNLDAEIIDGIVEAVNRANSSLKKIPERTLDFKKAASKFYEQHPNPFIWSSK